MTEAQSSDSRRVSVGSRRCPLCGLQTKVEEYLNEAGEHYYRCLSKTEGCQDSWQCPLNSPLPADPDRA